MNWQQEHQQTLKGAQACNDYLGLDCFTDHPFKVKMPKAFADLININNPQDELLRQVLPSTSVLKNQTNFNQQPLADEQYCPVNGIIHKYPNRVLLIASSVCAIACRYCFRQNFAYKNHDIFKNMAEILAYLGNNNQVNEVILSGGDPLSLSDEKLATLLPKLASIAHIKTLRIHTRTGVILPSRLTGKLSKLLINTPLKVVIVFHINHPKEMSALFVKKIQSLSTLTLLNQSVLLVGVNDNKQTLINLSQQLFVHGILPYYLHQLDKVIGAEHFLVTDKKAQELHQALKDNLSGYLVPKLVRDDGDSAKTWIDTQ